MSPTSPTYPPGLPTVQTDTETWVAQDRHVERLMDNSAFTSAHPDDTLVLAGPARLGSLFGDDAATSTSLLAVGMLQNFQVSQNKPTTPIMSIGSGRQSFVSGKAQTTWGISRLFLNGRNLLRVLSTQAVQSGISVDTFDDPAANKPVNNPSQQFVNLDSELFLIPFGLAVLFRDKTRSSIGAFYLELCVINSWNIAFSSGQNFIAENVSGLSDRVLPMQFTAGDNGDHGVGGSKLSIGALNLKADPAVLFGDLSK